MRSKIVRLRIIAVNDVYSLESLPRLAGLVDSARALDPADELLITVAGDFLAPSLLSSVDQGRGMVDCLNALGVTHITLGNHEDDLETEDLFARLEELDAKVLLSNVPGFRGRHQVSDVVDVAGVPVGMVGVVNGDPSMYHRAPFGGAKVDPPNETALQVAGRLRADGCVAVVALTHQWLPDDRALAESGGVDLVLGGHEHEGYLETNHAAPLAKAPVNATSAVVADVSLAVNASGEADVTATVRFEAVDAYPEDHAMRARVDRHMEKVRVLEERTLLRMAKGEVLSSDGARSAQTSFGTLVCSRLRDTLGAEVGVFNAGGLRGDGEYRDRLTFADFQGELPFDNEAVVTRLPGSLIRDVVHFSHTERRGTGGFLQLDDGANVDDAGHLERLADAPLEPARLYRVAIVRDLLVGMDEITPLLAFVKIHPERIPPATTGIYVKVALLRTFEVKPTQ